jgi:catechol 2,3-dioxygenase-like lactoylglutathione lyase family enzyme
MNYVRFDHCVLTCADVEATADFYGRVLGMQVVLFGEGRKALKFGQSKINLHQAGNEIEPTALRPGPGTEHLCFVVSDPLEEVVDSIKRTGTKIESGPIERVGAIGPILSVYVRDPDENLIEISNLIREENQYVTD